MARRIVPVSETFTSGARRQGAGTVLVMTAALLIGVSCAANPHVPATDRPGRPPESSPATPQSVESLSPVIVPPSIDATGREDVAEELNTFLASVPDGSRIDFDAGGKYRLSRGLQVWDKRGLVFEGNGASLVMEGFDGSDLAIQGSTDIVVRNLSIDGDNPDAGTADAFHPDGQEFSHGIAIRGSHDVEIDDVAITGVWGDGIFVGVPGRDFTDWSSGVWIHDSSIERNGRMGVVVNAGSDVIVERVRFDEIAISVFDIEPDDLAEGAQNVTFRDNTVGSYGHTDRYVGYLLESSGLDGASIRSIALYGNQVTGSPSGLDGTMLGIHTRIDARRTQDIWITDNVGAGAADGSKLSGAVLDLAHIDGLTVTRNTQPLATGQLVRIRDSTEVVSD
jgi:hypothetical protein